MAWEPPDPATRAWSACRNLLCIRLDSRGDVLMTTPALRALKEAVPRCRLTLLTSPAGAEVARLIPQVDAVYSYQAPWMKTPGEHAPARDLQLIEHLRRGNYDGAVIFTVYSQSPLPAALLCHLSGIPRRLAHCRENPYHLLTDWVPETEPQGAVRHEVRRQLDLVRAIGAWTDDEGLSLHVSATARRRVRALLNAEGVGGNQPWAVVHTGASAPSRRYPLESFRAVAAKLIGDAGWQLVFTGMAEEAERIDEIRRGHPRGSVTFAGRLAFEELAALIAHAPILISNNTAATHVASAVGTPTVCLYALTNVQHAPWRVPSRILYQDVPCRLCYRSVCPEGHHDCLRRIPPAAVVAAARELHASCHGTRTHARRDVARWIHTADELLLR